MDTRKLIASALGMSLLIAAVPGTALAQDEEAPDSGLSPEGVEWTLKTLPNEPVAEGVEVTLFLSGGEVVGNAGCNSYFGSYELDGSALTFPNPFGVTMKMCDETAMAVEGAYLPLLQETASWSIDEEGSLFLADADGVDRLVYGEAAIDVTASDVDALITELEALQAQIDEASAEVAALAAAAESINVNKLDKRISSIESDVAQLNKKVGGISSANLKKRIAANEEAIASHDKRIDTLEKTVDRFRERIIALEENDKEQDKRLDALEDAVFVPTPTSE